MRIPLVRPFAVVALIAALVASGCSDVPVEGDYPRGKRSGESHGYGTQDNILGSEGISLFGGGSKGADDGGGGGIGVNGFLWRASLDTVSFMPVNSADPFGGVIITDWYSPPESPNERFKMNVYILGRALRADGVRVSVFRQIDDGSGGWRDAPLPGGTDTRIEDAILTKARQLRFAVLQE
jgi:hypothetical protein